MKQDPALWPLTCLLVVSKGVAFGGSELSLEPSTPNTPEGRRVVQSGVLSWLL